MRSTWVMALALVGCALDEDDDWLETVEQEVVNRDPSFVYVYVNNIENLERPGDGCSGDWRDLIWEMKTGASPDLFLVQQISGREQLDFLVDTMTRQLHGKFEGIIAEGTPDKMKSPCGAQKAHQTNAIIYRVGRFDPVGPKEVWQVQAWIDGACRRSRQARTKSVKQTFRDKISGKLVTAASIHWGTAQGSGPDPACARENVIELDERLRDNAALTIWGGDTNERDRGDAGFKRWYEVANGDRDGRLGYRDVIYRRCMKADGTLGACLRDNWTIGNDGRIDFLFARTRNSLPPVGGAHTVTFAEADASARRFERRDSPANYSDHRAVRARIGY